MDPERLRESRASSSGDTLRNNFSPQKDDRYYLREDEIHLIETEFPSLVNGTENNRLTVHFGPSHRDRGANQVSGDINSVVDPMMDALSDADNLYANISSQSSSPAVAVQMTYQGSATAPVVETIARNADAVMTELTERVSE